MTKIDPRLVPQEAPMPRRSETPEEVTDAVRRHIEGVANLRRELEMVNVELTAERNKSTLLGMEVEMVRSELAQVRADGRRELDAEKKECGHYRRYAIGMARSLTDIRDTLSRVLKEADEAAYAVTGHEAMADAEPAVSEPELEPQNAAPSEEAETKK